MEIQFESASNLISLNIDLTFGCSDSARLLKDEEGSPEEVPGGSSLLPEAAAGVEDIQEASVPDEAISSLGQFTIKGTDS